MVYFDWLIDQLERQMLSEFYFTNLTLLINSIKSIII
jgi:hypothetical protein